jgi:hypothetical protein
MRLRGLLLDSGDTIVGPRGGCWNPRFDFECLVLARWPAVPPDRLAPAFAAGKRFTDHLVPLFVSDDGLNICPDDEAVAARSRQREPGAVE